MSLKEPFARGNSPLHHLDPRVKLAAAAAYAVVVALLGDLRVLGAALAISGGLVVLARLDGPRFLRRLLAANVFIVFLWIFLPWSVPGRALWSLGPLAVTAEGVRLSLLISMKCNAILAAMTALLATSPLHDLAGAMGRLGAPKKLLVVFYLCLRYLHIIHDESLRLRQAAAVRGFVPRTSLRAYRTYANFLGSLLVRSDERATRVYSAMLCRGFGGSFPALSARRARASDLAAGAALFLVAALLGGLEWRLRS